jgi:hypothetical protein
MARRHIGRGSLFWGLHLPILDGPARDQSQSAAQFLPLDLLGTQVGQDLKRSLDVSFRRGGA